MCSMRPPPGPPPRRQPGPPQGSVATVLPGAAARSAAAAYTAVVEVSEESEGEEEKQRRQSELAEAAKEKKVKGWARELRACRAKEGGDNRREQVEASKDQKGKAKRKGTKENKKKDAAVDETVGVLDDEEAANAQLAGVAQTFALVARAAGLGASTQLARSANFSLYIGRSCSMTHIVATTSRFISSSAVAGTSTMAATSTLSRPSRTSCQRRNRRHRRRLHCNSHHGCRPRHRCSYH